ncbi:MAG: hypothetical protein Q4G30_01640 [Actinomycetaceae bacterium]|nr:hypothetical protein [Actinomycetaceae bacterium]
MKGKHVKRLVGAGVGYLVALFLFGFSAPMPWPFLIALCFAGIPAGWRSLTKITPDVFLFLPLIGWVIYFGVKAVLAVIVGVVALPIYAIKAFREISMVNKMLAEG